jgi:long-subunit fatty acid transport protein
MGGTAIGYVDDPSAAFHNPAGLQWVQGLTLLGDFSLILAEIRASPDNAAKSIDSNTIVAPFPMLAAGYRLQEWVSLGIAGFPVASGAAKYEYDNILGNPVTDDTRVLFIEGTILASLNVPEDKLIPGKLAFGAGWRVTNVSLDREKTNLLDLDLNGTDWGGYRLGLQYRPIPEFSIGAAYRSKVDITADADDGRALVEVQNPEFDFVLPQKWGFGARFDWDRIGVAVDYEFTDQSQNDEQELRGEVGGRPLAVNQIFNWQDGHTIRAGVEYRVAASDGGYVPLRAGYIWDGQVNDPAYPSAFGTPPTSTNSITVGLGYVVDRWQVNAAGAYRFGSTTVTEGELGTGCDQLCAKDGDYRIRAVGIYLDGSVRFDVAGL